MRAYYLFITILLSGSFLNHTQAQWPGNFYAFILRDEAGNIVGPDSTKYKMVPVDDSVTDVVLGIKICTGDSIWRFYEGGNHYMGSTQKLKIIKYEAEKATGTMVIEFPPSISGGKERYYRNLYTGSLRYKNGTVKIKLPRTGAQWDKLEEHKLCEDGINFTGYFDISKFQ